MESSSAPVVPSVVYTDFFVFPNKATKKEDCSAKCKVCLKNYKYTLTTKGNIYRQDMNEC